MIANDLAGCDPSPSNSPPVLSICIATYKRADFIRETLESIVVQLNDRCELVIVDGASPDDTETVVRPFTRGRGNVRYIRETTNSGVDADYDKAVGHAAGRFCWLMTDDDLLVPGAVVKVMAFLSTDPDLVVVNAEVRTADFAAQLKPALLDVTGASTFDASTADTFFAECARYLSFIGSVVVRRAFWLGRERSSYYGSHFIHVGVLFQSPPVASIQVIREPLIVIRYGNAAWSPRGFDIWMLKWPTLIWSFEHFPDATRRRVSPPAPCVSLDRLLWYRAIGGYSALEYRTLLAGRVAWPTRILAVLVARMPERLVNACCGIYCWLRPPQSGLMALYEMATARHAASLTKALARRRSLIKA